jgi:hypothetical protein
MSLADWLTSVSPWGRDSGIRWVLLTPACAVAMFVAWFGVSGRGILPTQIGWLTAGIVTLMVALYVQASLVIRGRRAVGERRYRLISDAVLDIEAGVVPHGLAHGRDRAAAPRQTEPARVLTVAGLNLYHRPECPMVDGRHGTLLLKSVADDRGMQPCGICLSPALSTLLTSSEVVTR